MFSYSIFCYILKLYRYLRKEYMYAGLRIRKEYLCLFSFNLCALSGIIRDRIQRPGKVCIQVMDLGSRYFGPFVNRSRRKVLIMLSYSLTNGKLGQVQIRRFVSCPLKLIHSTFLFIILEVVNVEIRLFNTFS
jgi:hypothetical protein